DKHTQRHTQRPEERMGHCDEERETEQHEDESDDDCIDERVEVRLRLLALITCNYHCQILRQLFVRLHFFNSSHDIIRRRYEVISSTLDDIQRNNILSVQARITIPFFNCIPDLCNIAEVHSRALCAASNHDVLHVARSFKLTFDTQGSLHIADLEKTTSDVHVLSRNGILNLHEAHPCGRHFVWININLNLSLRCTHDLCTCDLRQLLKPILHPVRVFLQSDTVIVTTKVHEHDRHLTERELLYIRFLRQIRR